MQPVHSTVVGMAIQIKSLFFVSWSYQKLLFMIRCMDRKKKCFFISKVWKMAKKGLKMTFFPIKSQYFAGDRRWVSYIPKWALIYDWLLGKGLIFRTLQNSSQGDAKSWKNHKKREKLSKNLGSLQDFNPGPVGKIGNSV